LFLVFAVTSDAEPAEAQSPASQQTVDLVFYGDTRGGVLQTFLNHKHRPKEIHAAVAGKIGSLENLAEQRAIVFLGDAVSHGGCPSLWSEDFLPALKSLKAFRQDQDLFFFPVVGDHETYLIPESYEDLGAVSTRCPFFQAIYRAPGESMATAGRPVSRAVHRELISERGIPAQLDCPPEEERICRNPGVENDAILKAHCRACKFQREYCEGNCVRYAFINYYSRENGFGPFQDAWGESQRGATWYKVDFRLTGAGNQKRTLRVLLLDTQAAEDLRPHGSQTQAEWMTDRVGELEPGAFLVVAGHQPPPLRGDLYEPILRAAFRRGVRVVAVVAAHYHGFGSGTYTLRGDDPPDAPPQIAYLALSGDGGGRDFDEKEVPTADRMVGTKIGDHIRVSVNPDSPWKADGEKNASSFNRLRISFDGLQVTEYRVPLASVATRTRDTGRVTRSVQALEPVPLRSMTLPALSPR
jgi:hypothetical protein